MSPLPGRRAAAGAARGAPRRRTGSIGSGSGSVKLAAPRAAVLCSGMRSVVWSPRYECDIGAHVFPTSKYRLVRDRLLATGVVAPVQVLEPEPATRQALELVHTPAYLDDFLNLRPTPRVLRSELPIAADIRDAYLLAAGGTLLAARRALQDGAAMHLGGGFHHAMPDHAEGFCYLHDVALAIRVLQVERRVGRAAIIDTDLHQGNGTARIFQSDPSVFTFSIHQENNYPIKERGDWDIGLADGTADAEYLARLGEAVPRVLDGVRPDLVLMVAGADPYVEDQLGGLAISQAGLRERDRLVVRACAARGIPIAGVLAGGYARRIEDTVAIHAATAAEVLAWQRPEG
jgi:acetoin utilization deacetylase AcuC-like enzyme